jgi:hypothetical protein
MANKNVVDRMVAQNATHSLSRKPEMNSVVEAEALDRKPHSKGRDR